MKRVEIFLVCLMLVTSFFVILPSKTIKASGNTFYVGGIGPGNYTTIQSAINDSNPGDTVFVFNGYYTESVVVNKSINLVGENKISTIIQPSIVSPSNAVVYITADWVNLSGFKIQPVIDGITIYYSNHSNIIDNNVLNSPIQDGIKLSYSNYNTIIGNNVSHNRESGIQIQNSSYNTISDNNANENHNWGINLFDGSNYNTVTGNSVNDCANPGISLIDSNNNIISGNHASDGSSHGISLSNSSYNTITSNIIINTTDIGISLTSSSNNIIYNNFLNNTQYSWSKNADDDGNNVWNINKILGTNIIGGPYLGGNYWSDYTGMDLDSDGIGEIPYNILGGSNKDNYPLMNLPTPENPPVFGTPSPSNGSAGNQLSMTWSIPIYDPEGDLFNWTIQCSNGQTNNANGAINGTKSLSLSGLTYSTTYKIWVNATDSTSSNQWTMKWYTFTTKKKISDGGGGGGGSTSNTPPISNTNGPYYEYVDIPITFDGSASKDTDGNITNYIWIFGDGTTGTEKIITHKYDKVGNYTITLTVTDNEGKTHTNTTYAVITEKPNSLPIADFSHLPLNPTTDDKIQYTDLSIDTDGTIISYYWNFSDGTYSTNKNPNHIYNISGTYIVSLIIKDNNNDTDTISKTIIVDESQNKNTTDNEKDNGTPGFELISIILAITLFSLWKRKRKL